MSTFFTATRDNNRSHLDAEYNLTNPDGVKLDIGYDFVEATFRGFVNESG